MNSTCCALGLTQQWVAIVIFEPSDASLHEQMEN